MARSSASVTQEHVRPLSVAGTRWSRWAEHWAAPSIPAALNYLLPLVVVLGLLFMAANLLVRPIFLGNDSMQHYAYTWFLSQEIFERGHIPSQMYLLDGGEAPIFPYGIPVYMAGAALYRLFGDWSVSLLMAIALLGAVAAVTLARPAMRAPWLMILFLLNPFLVDAVYSFQLTSLWSIFFFFLFVWAFEKRALILAAIFLWLTISAHPLIGGVAVISYGVSSLVSNRMNLRPLLVVAVPVAAALLPVLWFVLDSSYFSAPPPMALLLSKIYTILRRGSIILMPFVLAALAPHIKRFYLPTLLSSILLMALGVELLTGPVRLVDGTYYGALHSSTNIYADFLRSPLFQPGTTYRVLAPGEREDGMYYLIRHGALLATDFFSELRRNWASTDEYRCFLASKGVQYVAAERAYFKQFPTNEGQLLEEATASGQAQVLYRDPQGRYTIYDVQPLINSLSDAHC